MLWLGAVSRSKAKRKTAKTTRARQPRARALALQRTTRTRKRPARTQTVPTRPKTTSVSPPLSQSQPSTAAPLVQLSPPIGRALLISPEHEKFVDSLHPTFRWLSVGGATQYEIMWGEDPTFSTHHTLQSVATEAAVPRESPLEPGKTYYWRVRGGNALGWSPWSETHWFRVLEEST